MIWQRRFHVFPPAYIRSRDSHGPVMRGQADQVPAVGEVKEGGLADRDGRIVVRRGDTFEPLTLPSSVSRENSRNASGS